MRQTESHRAAREARDDVVAHGKQPSRHESAIDQYLASLAYRRSHGEPPAAGEAADRDSGGQATVHPGSAPPPRGMPPARTTRPARHRFRVINGVTRALLYTPVLRRLADHQVMELRFTAARSGRPVALPVMYAERDGQLVILVGGPAGKRWWRNFRAPRRVRVLLRGQVRTGMAHIVTVGAPNRTALAGIYTARYPSIAPGDDPLVVVTLDAVPAAG